MAGGRMVIVGGGLAAARAAEGLRDEGHDGEILIVSEESRLPYERPPLSKGVLLGADEPEVVFTHDAAWYAAHGVELREGEKATAIDPAAHTVTVSGEMVGYERLLLATGASPRRLPGPGGRLGGVHHLRRLDDSLHLRDALAGGDRRVVIVGSGWIGLEVAAAARSYGNEVTVLGRGAVPLESAIGAELGEVFAELHREHGVDVRTGVRVEEIEGDDDGRVASVALGDHVHVPADLVVVGIGAAPNTGLAAVAGLTIGDGIETDSGFRTSASDVFAAGDVASVMNPTLGHRLRVEHWANALNGGHAAGRAMAGAEIAYDEIPYFYTDQYELGMEYSGYGELMAGARIVIRGELETREFVAFWLQDGRVVAGMNVNVWDVNDAVQRLIRSAERVDPDRLADTEVPLDSIVGDAPGAG